MPDRKKKDTRIPVKSKDCWHSYGLQSLPPSRFAVVIGKILSNHHRLIAPRRERNSLV